MTENGAVVGGEIDSWCTKCKLELNHTIVALVDGKPKRVERLTCNGQHNYAKKPGVKKAAAATTTTRKTTRKKSTKRKAPLELADRPARAYSTAGSYGADEVILHAKYGRGLVIGTRGNKIDVEFQGEGAKTLIHVG